jgi:hypothetical protein
MKKETYIYDLYIEKAYLNKDYDEAVNAFLDILDYDETILNAETYNILLYVNKQFLKDKIYFEVLQV